MSTCITHSLHIVLLCAFLEEHGWDIQNGFWLYEASGHMSSVVFGTFVNLMDNLTVPILIILSTMSFRSLDSY